MIIRPFEYWESERTTSYIPYPNRERRNALKSYFDTHFNEIIKNPFLNPSEIERKKLARVKELVKLAYEKIPLYREKYDKARISPNHINSWDDFSSLPIIFKDDLIESFPHNSVDFQRFREDELFMTRSSGSTGHVVRVYMDFEAILKDTIQGVRQFFLQSGLKYNKNG